MAEEVEQVGAVQVLVIPSSAAHGHLVALETLEHGLEELLAALEDGSDEREVRLVLPVAG